MKINKGDIFQSVIRNTEAYVNYLKDAALYIGDDIFLKDYVRYCEEVLGKMKHIHTGNPDFAMQLFFAVESLRKYYQDMHWAKDDLFRDKCAFYLTKIQGDAKKLMS